jgi:hypothetical protein
MDVVRLKNFAEGNIQIRALAFLNRRADLQSDE